MDEELISLLESGVEETLEEMR